MVANILVVDDDPDVREILRAHLEDAGHTVDEAANGEIAIQRLREQPADLVITDIYMPVSDGLDLMRRIRSFGLKMPIIEITGATPRIGPIEQQLFNVAAAQGPHKRLRKPILRDDLIAAVDELLRGV